MARSLISLVFILLFFAVAPAQVFKIPKDVLPLPSKDSGFDHGMLMIRKDKPGGLFIQYPKENETLDQLKQRLAAYVVPMFLHDKDEVAKLLPQIASIPSHKGDIGSTAQMYLYVAEKGQLQVLFFERGISDKTYVYGYFAYRSKASKDGSKDWADGKGTGVKFFDDFWKTISP